MKSITEKKSKVGLEAMKIQPFKVNNALIGLKLQERDDAALEYLRYFSKNIPVKNTYFIHVVPDLHMFSDFYDGDGPSPGTQIALNEKVNKLLKAEIYDRFENDIDTKVNTEVRIGNPLEELLNKAKEIEADLIVIGQESHESGQGVLAKKMVRKVKGNALVIPAKAVKTLTKILVPVDFSTYSMDSLSTALAIQKRLPGSIEIIGLHLYEMPDFSSYNILRSREKFTQMIEEDRWGAFNQLFDNFNDADISNVKKVVMMKEKPGISKYILNFARKEKVDFIVMGAKGHSRVENLFMGSVTEKLLTINDNIPTMVIK